MKYTLAIGIVFSSLVVMAQSHTIQYTPTHFYRNFSHKIAPVLNLAPGDTLICETIDAGGNDKTGAHLGDRGNPQTGPFYINGAMPGDVLAVTLVNISLNRNYAVTLEAFNRRCLPFEIIKPVYARNAKGAKWTLDRNEGYAYPQNVHEHLSNLKVSLKPFLGCLGVAAPAKDKEPLTYFAGQYGGNMDFYKVTQGTTVYLPVFHEGALLYFGDGHAAQGDGEINGDALETSMDVALVTRIIKASELSIKFPRLEDAEHIMAVGTNKKMEEALKLATLGLLQWIQHDYGLSLNEATQVLGPSIEYKIPTLSGPTFEIVAMIKKGVLSRLRK